MSATTLETQVKQHHRKILLAILKQSGLPYRISSPETGGDPDFNYCICGKLYWHIEFKHGGDIHEGGKIKPTFVKEGSRQDIRIKEMRGAGETVFVLHSRDECDQWFEHIFPTLPALRGIPDEPWVPALVDATNAVIQSQKARQNTRHKRRSRPKAPTR